MKAISILTSAIMIRRKVPGPTSVTYSSVEAGWTSVKSKLLQSICARVQEEGEQVHVRRCRDREGQRGRGRGATGEQGSGYSHRGVAVCKVRER